MNEMIFYMLVQIHETSKLTQGFLGGVVKNGHGLLVHEILKFAVS